MNGQNSPGDAPTTWLAATMRSLLEKKYGPGRVPGVRRISADIRAANHGETISHGHVHNILNGDADNLTDKTRALLATFFGEHPSFFHPPSESAEPQEDAVQVLAARFATFDEAQIAAIKQAIEIVGYRTTPEEPRDEGR